MNAKTVSELCAVWRQLDLSNSGVIFPTTRTLFKLLGKDKPRNLFHGRHADLRSEERMLGNKLAHEMP